MTSTRIGVIGCGYWGPNLVRMFLEAPEAVVCGVADKDPARIAHMRSRHSQIQHFTDDYRQLFPLGLDAVVVSTPPETHFDIVRSCLAQGLDVFVEKPLATDTAQALELVRLAGSLNRVVMVGHIGAYNPAVRALKEMMDSGELGDIRYIDAVRAGLGIFHPTLNVMWDLAPHDIAILLYLLDELPETVSARGVACVRKTIEDVVYMTVTFPSHILAHVRLSWLDPAKTRRITVVGSQKMVVYDDLENHEKLKIYDKRVNVIRRTDTYGDYQFAYHYGSVVSPYVHFEEPLRVECLHFLECVAEHKQPLTDGENGLRVVEVIEAADKSLRLAGAQVPLDSSRVAMHPVGAGAPSTNGNGHGIGVPVDPVMRPEWRA